MQTITRQISSPAEVVLSEIESFSNSKFRKATVVRSANTVSIEAKLLWQSQTTICTINENKIEVRVNNVEALGRAIKIINSIEQHLNDQGWNDAIQKHNTPSVKQDMIRFHALAFLYSDEKVVVATQGYQLKKSSTIVATNKRVFLLENSTFGQNSANRTISLDKISSITATKSAVVGSIEITTSNETIKIDRVVANEIDEFVTTVRHMLDSSSKPEESQITPTNGANTMEEIQKLAELHSAGILTDEEFSAAKAKALGI